ncbi:hypothetical protein BDV24DRAFT_137488 [Aspergillus arachidicola]|uniref:Uncharacterized protein n=1 Tax=Aspergillus arachidicola TaxID=656916 RepID=A0A5N6XZS3_9EURO|nr:hypothetical protein BDV24DRAFT_137488 [Aspergillus arachidicola]
MYLTSPKKATQQLTVLTRASIVGDLFYSVLINDVPSNTYRTGMLYVTVLITKVLLFTVNQSIRRRAT